MSTSLLTLKLLMQLAVTTPQMAHQPVTITEVEILAVTSSNQAVWLSVDPGFANPIFFDAPTLATYERGLGMNVTPVKIKLSDLTRNQGKYFAVKSGSQHVDQNHLRGSIVFRTRDGKWFEIEDLQAADTARIYYRDPGQPGGPTYNMALPMTATGRGGVDVVFWSVTHRSLYREGWLDSGQTINTLKYSDIHGIYPLNKYPQATVRYMPNVGRAGKYHSETGEICYHFENCQWSCVAK